MTASRPRCAYDGCITILSRDTLRCGWVTCSIPEHRTADPREKPKKTGGYQPAGWSSPSIGGARPLPAGRTGPIRGPGMGFVTEHRVTEHMRRAWRPTTIKTSAEEQREREAAEQAAVELARDAIERKITASLDHIREHGYQQIKEYDATRDATKTLSRGTLCRRLGKQWDRIQTEAGNEIPKVRSRVARGFRDEAAWVRHLHSIGESTSIAHFAETRPDGLAHPATITKRMRWRVFVASALST